MDRKLLFEHPILRIEEVEGFPGGPRLIAHRGRFAAIALSLHAPPQEEQFLVVMQYRVAAREVFYEHPAGMVDAGETPVETALRELAEETGWLLTTTDLTPLTPPEGIYPSPAVWDEVGHFYAARLQVPEAVLQAYRHMVERQFENEKLRLTVIPGKVLLSHTRNLQTIAHTYLYYAHFGAPDGGLPSPAA